MKTPWHRVELLAPTHRFLRLYNKAAADLLVEYRGVHPPWHDLQLSKISSALQKKNNHETRLKSSNGSPHYKDANCGEKVIIRVVMKRSTVTKFFFLFYENLKSWLFTVLCHFEIYVMVIAGNNPTDLTNYLGHPSTHNFLNKLQ